MDWGYVAGFFDGEGWISLWKNQGSTGRTDYSIGCCQSTPQAEVLDVISAFLEQQGIKGSKVYVAMPNGERRSPVSKLYVQGSPYDKMLFLRMVIPHLVIKKERAIRLLEFLENRPVRNTQWYPDVKQKRCAAALLEYQSGESIRLSSRHNKIGETTLRRYLKKQNIPLRPRSESLALSWEIKRRS